MKYLTLLGVLFLASCILVVDGRAKPEKEEAPKQADPLDNPIVGAYQGTKPRSVGNSTSTDIVVPPTTPAEQQYTCVPAMDSEGGGKGKYISIDDPHTPKNIESQRRQLITDQLSVGDTIYLDGNSCKIKKFWKDSQGRNAAIQCENHTNRTFNNNSKICW